MNGQTSAEFLYERISRAVTAMIADGRLKSGDRVPSLRRMSADMRVSLSTVNQAYLELERQGIIEARPQSGYYVKPSGKAAERPRTSAPDLTPTMARRSDYFLSIVGLMADNAKVPLGTALPDPELMAGRQLNACLRQVLSDNPDLTVRYSDVAGDAGLRIQLAAHMLTKGVSVSPEEIIVTNGATEAAYAVLRAITRPGDMVAVESPAYYGLINLFETLGLYALEIPTHASEGIELGALERILERYDVRACVLQPNFGNPLGGLYSEAKRRALLELLTAKNVPLIEDDVYGDLSHSGQCPASIKAFDRSGSAVYLSSFSKTIAPGLRIGWIIPGRFRDAVLRQRIATTLSNATPDQAALAAYLASGRYSRHVRKLGATLKGQVQDYRQQIGASFPAGTRVTDPGGGFLLWVELPEGVDTMELYRAALGQGVVFAPGPLFTSQDRFGSHLRISCGYQLTPRFAAGIETVGRLAKQQLGQL